MAKCPRCKEDMPLLSKICPQCGHVEEGEDENLTVDGFLATLEQKLHEIKQTPHPTFGRSFEVITLLIFPLLALIFLVTAIVAEAGFAWILFGILVLLSVRAFIRRGKGKIGNGAVNRKFAALKNEFEYNARLAKRKFGRSSEVSDVLSEISDEITSVERERKSIATKNIVIWIVILGLLGGLIAWGVMSSGEKAPKDPEAVTRIADSKIEKMVDEYRAAGPEAVGAEQKRIDIVKEMLSAGEPSRAEDFFFSDCMGQMKDFECAAPIVEYYTGDGEEGPARDFVAKCNGMRYKSDKGKLEKLLTR